jgi:glycosyltransferase involved in cell wall biosynthesis
VGEIIDAFALVSSHHPQCHLVIGNDGSLRQELRERVQGHGIGDRTTFIGPLPESDLPNLMRASTVYVTASEVDGSSVTLLQAMSCAVPVVASATPGNAEWVVPGETGYVFTTGSPQEMAVAMSAALSDSTREDPQGLTAKARNLVKERADWNRNRRALDTIMRAAQRGHL